MNIPTTVFVRVDSIVGNEVRGRTEHWGKTFSVAFPLHLFSCLDSSLLKPGFTFSWYADPSREVVPEDITPASPAGDTYVS